MKIHSLKTWPLYFHAVAKGEKTFEVRRNDRDFQQGDILLLREYRPHTYEYSGRYVIKQVTYILNAALPEYGSAFAGIEAGYCVLALGEVNDITSLAHEAVDREKASW